jgi:antitoxin component YwqK of YwqJK toxin-antitoxin module
LRHGRGKFFYQDGGYFDGEWKKNQMHGWGKLFYEGGQLAYEGNWAHD